VGQAATACGHALPDIHSGEDVPHDWPNACTTE